MGHGGHGSGGGGFVGGTTAGTTAGYSSSPFAGLGPEDEQSIRDSFGLGLYDDEQGLIQQQMALAQELRRKRGPEGREAGGTYVAANPLEHIAYFLEQRKGDEMLDKAIGDSKALMDKQRTGSVDLILRLLRGEQGDGMGTIEAPREW